MEQAKKSGALIDFRVMACGDDLELLMSHKKGCDNGEIHALAWETFEEATEMAKKLKLYGAGQDLLADAFSGNIRGMGPGVAEMEINERTSEPVVAFMMDKTEPGAFNLPIFKIFADPFNTAGLVIDPACHHGFTFEVWDIMEHKTGLHGLPGRDVRPAGPHRCQEPLCDQEGLLQAEQQNLRAGGRSRGEHGEALPDGRHIRGQG